MYKLHTHCRACGYATPGANGTKSAQTEKLIEVLDLGVQPLANDFCKDGEPRSGYAPLKVLFCPRCSLAQLSVVVDPKILYSHYNYVTSPSQMMQEHFKQLITDISQETYGKTVLEIGSNDGRLLNMMRDGGGYEVQGVDPAENLAAIAESHGIRTHVGLFDHDMSLRLSQYDVVIARHVFCHVDDWREFIRSVDLVSHDETLVCIEVPYAADTIRNCEFDQIYHEHLSYLTVKSVKALLEHTRFKLHRVIRYPIHGGALLLMLRTIDTHRSQPSDGMIFETEITADDWINFSTVAHWRMNDLKDAMDSLIPKGKRVAGLGASAKSTVWINACGFNRKQIEFIADNTPQKQYTFSPGTDIPIVDEGAIMRELPDYVVIFAWNYLEEILKKFEPARAKGVKFIVPVPTVRVI